MKSAIAIGCLLMFACGALFADDAVPEFQFTGGFVGVGSRATAMGGAHIALAQDFSAAYYNPACLAFVYKNEIIGGLSIRNGNSEITYNSGAPQTSSFSAVKLSQLGAVMPLPSKQGGTAFAIGFSRFQTFDFTNNFVGTRVDNANLAAQETYDGGMGAIHFAGALQTSEYISVGASLDILMGAENYTWEATIADFADTTVLDSILSDMQAFGYAGVTGKLGMLITPTKFAALGMVVGFPSAISIDYELIQETTVHYADGDIPYESYYQSDYDISVTTPFQFGGGLAIKTPIANLAADVIYADWRQMRFHTAEWLDYNPQIPGAYRATLSFGIGAEFSMPIKFLPTKLRAGYRYDPLPYVLQTVQKERQAITGGIAFLIDKNWLIEGSVALSNWQKSGPSYAQNTIGEKYDIYDVMLGLAFRF